MKKIIIIIVILLAIVGGAYYALYMNPKESVKRCGDGFRFDPARKECVIIEQPAVEKQFYMASVRMMVPETTIQISLQKDKEFSDLISVVGLRFLHTSSRFLSKLDMQQISLQ